MENTQKQWFGHPRGLATLFFTEMWERFSYYGMRGLLMIFMVTAAAEGGLGFAEGQAGIVYGLYTSLVYLATVPGGLVADKFLGQRNAVFFGGIIIALGHFAMAFPTELTFYFGLFLIVVGTGLLKPNISVMVGQLYSESDVRRDAGFSIFYMGINLGAFIAPLLTGFLAQHSAFKGFLSSVGINPASSWHFAFALAGIGMTLGLVQYAAGKKYLFNAGKHELELQDTTAYKAQSSKGIGMYFGGLVALLAVIIGIAYLFVNIGYISDFKAAAGHAYELLMLIGTAGFFGWLFSRKYWTADERKRLIVIFVLFVGAVLFWGIFEQAGSVLNLFANEKTDLFRFGFEIPAAWFQAVNSIFIIVLAPIFAWLWLRLAQQGKEPTSPAKFSIGIFFVALSAVLMYFAAGAVASGKVSPMWLVGTYLLQTIGELCLSPVGLSSMTRLAPPRIVSLMMGTWFLAASIGNYFAGKAAVYSEKLPMQEFYLYIFVIAFIASFVMFSLVKPINRMMAKSE